ncbi:MAG: energy transducer TonB, partial [Rhodobacteraceae bacterium]|nr:energy transducer TonB [Paracoccaceae bacterium]
MQAGYVISGIAHAVFIGWALFGGMFTPKDQEIVFNNVSVLSEAKFQAMIASDQVPEVPQFDLTALEPSEDTDVVPTLAEQ